MKLAVAGHICLDVIPEMPGAADPGADPNVVLRRWLKPGALTVVGGAVLATGGAVSNTGIALHRLGLDVALMAKVGDDAFGRTVLGILRGVHPSLADGMIVGPGEQTSYTIVINPPGVDRMFLHCPGANHTFRAADIADAKLAGVDLFHFGYPPLMRNMYQAGGAEMRTLFERARRAGALTALDMAGVDPAAEAGQVDWTAWLRHVLPAVDLFLPSLDEILFMVNRPAFDRLAARDGGAALTGVDRGLVEETAATLLDMGAAVAVIKLGDQGLYMRTGDRVPGRDAAWSRVSRFAPCYRAHVVGTTGAGDCTIAGLLAAFMRGAPPADVVATAVAVGACSTESADATGAVPPWDAVRRRMNGDWPRLPSRFVE